MRRWKLVVVIFSILAVAVVSVLAYRHRGEQLDRQAARAYHDGRPVESLALYRTVAQQYPSFLGSFARRATGRVCELDDYLHAVELQDGGQIDEAIAAYQSFLDEYCRHTPTSLYVSFVREAVANLKLEQAQGFRDSGKYTRAFGVYQSVLELEIIGGPYCIAEGEWEAACWQADATVEESQLQARAAIPPLLLEWAKLLERQGDYEGAFDKYQIVLQEYPDTPSAAQAEEMASYALSQSTGENGHRLMAHALTDVCGGRPAQSSAVGWAEDEIGRALFDGKWFTLPDDMLAMKPAHFRYAVCLTDGSTAVQHCSFDNGYTLVRQQLWWSVEVRDTRTGELVAERTFLGSMPDDCPWFHMFSEKTEYRNGGVPSVSEVLAWLPTVIR